MASRPTALVTGASSGIGAALARQLAGSGHDVVLVARRPDALEAVARQCRDASGGAAELLVADLETADGLAEVRARVADGARLDVVVNNAGFGSYGAFWDQPESVLRGMIEVNVVALAVLSRAALARMVHDRAGKLLNVSSTASFVPGPRGATYHATKAYVTSLTESLHEEARPFGVHVTALCPGVTPTGFQARAGLSDQLLPGFLLTDAEEVAAAGLAALGRNQAVCVPGVANQVTMVGARLTPRPVVRRLAGQVLRRF